MNPINSCPSYSGYTLLQEAATAGNTKAQAEVAYGYLVRVSVAMANDCAHQHSSIHCTAY